MKIQCLFIIRDETSGPELLEAWDGEMVAENFKGWEEYCQLSLENVRSQISHHFFVDVEVSDEALTKLAKIPTIEGIV